VELAYQWWLGVAGWPVESALDNQVRLHIPASG